jgi:hypothetical protein
MLFLPTTVEGLTGALAGCTPTFEIEPWQCEGGRAPSEVALADLRADAWQRPDSNPDGFHEVGYVRDELGDWFPEETQVDRPLGRTQPNRAQPNRAQRRSGGKRKPPHLRRRLRGGGFAE